MRRHALVITVLVASGLPRVASHAQQKVLVGHAASPTISMRLAAPVGDVKVIGWDRDSVEVSGTMPVGSRVEMYGGPPGELAKGVKMFIEMPAEASSRDGRLVLRVPRGARVWLKMGSADMDVTGVTGGLDLNIVGGSITVHGNPREVRAESMDGNVTIEGAPEWLRAKTATGDITLRGGQDIGASTISGTIRSSGGEVERARLESTTGAIVFASGLARSVSLELETHSGPIDLELPLKIDVELDAATITGAIDNQWTRARPLAGREGRGMTLATTSGMGGGRIVVRSFKGTVQLRARLFPSQLVK